MVLTINGIYKNFGAKEVLKGINLRAESGEALGLLGRNGAGKTTTLRIIMGIFRQDSGEVLIDGVPNAKTGVKIGYMPEERGLYPKKHILEQMVYLGQLRGLSAKKAKGRSEELLGRLEALEYIDKKLETLSKGNQQKIQLAIALISDPDIVILDEPFSGLDPVNSAILKKMLDEIVKENKIVLFSSHQMHYVEEFCRQVSIINNGRIVCDGNIRDIKKSYPRDRVLLVPKGGAANFHDFLVNARTDIIKHIERKEEACVVTLRGEDDGRALLSLLTENGFVPDAYSVVEPSLEDIFVEKAGDTDGTV